mmetsp:Transcript_51320/g.115655  ORF Transcript_51320/g.115655 Transcript_51320/m.115655 type:complete len:306 (-) Transcript_51320:147-1064(-)
MVDMAVAHPPVERFPTVGDLEEVNDTAGMTVSVPTFSELDQCASQGFEPPPTVPGPSAQVAAAATLSVSSSKLAASSLDTDNWANTEDVFDADDNVLPYPTLDYSALTQSQDLDVTMDASKPAALAAVAAAEDLDTTRDAMKPAATAAPLPTAQAVKDDLDATVHIPRMKTPPAERREELDATVELKLPVPQRDHSPTLAAQDASPPPTDVRRGYEALKQGMAQGSTEQSQYRQSQRSRASGSTHGGSSQAATSSSKAQGQPPAPPPGESLQFCSNRSKDKDGSEPGPLTSILQSFFVCFSRQSG